MNVLITGSNGYIARMLHAALSEARHEARHLNVRGDEWRNTDFTGYDSVVHLAGIAHNSSFDPEEYRRVNIELTSALAKKARDSGIPQFIFVSSMAVYGLSDVFAPLNELTRNTPLQPKTLYGKSKLSAESEVLSVYGDTSCIVRPPMVYGENCPGNYARLRNIVLKYKVIPNYKNNRGMIYVHNLCEMLKLLIENRASGYYHPQDAETLSTRKLADLIAEANGVKVRAIPIPFLKFAAKVLPIIGKAFGSLSYSPELTAYNDGNYQVYDVKSAIERTEKYWRER
ncbi:MAG: NAD-dependent epimerase/dehydratase family protein [Oscillospiraceae bacterium]|nr:NAD-dependent epimerase/dehydratase family protein [Oscillospiraceae bacterium]